MSRRCLFPLAAVLVSLAAVPAAHAAGPAADQAWSDCNGHDPGRKIAGCTVVLGRGEREAAHRRALAHNNRGFVHFRLGDLDRALADFDAAIRLDPADARIFTNRSQVRLGRGDPDGALADLDAAVRLDPRNAQALFGRGMIRKRKGDLNRALADFEAVVRLDPGSASAKRQRDETRAAAAAQKSAARPEAPAVAAAVAGQAAIPAPSRPMQPPAGPVPGETRVALVIGNAAYRAVSALPNPMRDAQAVAQALRGAGFMTVTLESDLGRGRLTDALRAFAAQAAAADWALIYYAGHGLEMGGVNYLLPVDARLKTDRDVQFEAVPLDQALAAVEGARKLRLVVLDACRDNPFAATMARTQASRSVGRGLARVEPEGGTLVAYAAKAGQVALDGDSRNSPFADALVRHLATPGIEINKLFRLVRDDVLTATGRRQEPFVYGSLPAEDFFFRPAQVN